MPSARRKLVNTGPGMHSIPCRPVAWSSLMTSVPVMSEGIRSGVNWMRRNSMSSVRASVRPMSVFPRPGTPCSSTWPRHKRPISRKSMISSCPTTTLAISSLTRLRASRIRATTAASSDDSAGGDLAWLAPAAARTGAVVDAAPGAPGECVFSACAMQGSGVGVSAELVSGGLFCDDELGFLRVNQSVAILVDLVEDLARPEELIPGQVAVVVPVHALKPDGPDWGARFGAGGAFGDELFLG